MNSKHLAIGVGFCALLYFVVNGLLVFEKFENPGSHYVGRDCKEFPAVEALQCQGINDLCRMHRLGASNANRAKDDKALAELLKACESPPASVPAVKGSVRA